MKELSEQQSLLEQVESGDLEMGQLESLGFRSTDDLCKKIKQLKIKLNLISKEQLEQEKYSLLATSDETLTEEQLKQKKFQ